MKNECPNEIQKTFLVSVVDKWNASGSDVVEADSVQSFKCRYDGPVGSGNYFI